MFDIVTAKDFYAMLVQDFDEFVENQASARKAMHCAITAYHLHDWAWAEICSNREVLDALGIVKQDKNEFVRKLVAFCPWFVFVQALANGSKHFRFEGDENIKTRLVGGWGSGPFGVGAYGHSYLLIDFGEDAAEHRWMAALTLLEVVVRFWRDFFRKYLFSPNQPESKHHVD